MIVNPKIGFPNKVVYQGLYGRDYRPLLCFKQHAKNSGQIQAFLLCDLPAFPFINEQKVGAKHDGEDNGFRLAFIQFNTQMLVVGIVWASVYFQPRLQQNFLWVIAPIQQAHQLSLNGEGYDHFPIQRGEQVHLLYSQQSTKRGSVADNNHFSRSFFSVAKSDSKSSAV